MEEVLQMDDLALILREAEQMISSNMEREREGQGEVTSGGRISIFPRGESNQFSIL